MSLLAAARSIRRLGTVNAITATRSAPVAASAVASAPASSAVPVAAACLTLRRSFWSASPAPLNDGAWKQYHRPITLQPVLPHVLRTVPEGILRPPYARPDANGDPRNSQHRLSGIEVKDAAAIAGMRVAGRAASFIRAYAGSLVRVGITPDEIDRQVHAKVVEQGWYPSPLGYAGFPKSICTSVNQIVVHGIPDGRPLERGDIVNIDVSVYVDGFHGDCSAMFVAGGREATDPLAQRLIDTTFECMRGAIALCKPGVPFNAIGAFIEPLAHSHGYSIVRQFCGHGIGSIFHMPPLIFHCSNGESALMQPGMTFTIEPLLNEGAADLVQLEDGWAMATADGSRSAQFEETILITETGHEILTKHE